MPTSTLSELIGRGRSKKAEASIVSAEPHALVVAVTEREDSKRLVTRTLRLSGQWRVNSRAEISFWLDKKEARRGVLHFGASWRVNERNEIELSLGRDKAVLDGSWDITDKHRIRYQIGRSLTESLNFRGSFGTKSILAKKGELRYQIGAEGSRKVRTKTITLFGKWVVSRDLGIGFEIEYANGRRRAIKFGGDVSLNDKTRLSTQLVTRAKKPLGVELLLTREILDGSVFACFAKSPGDTRVEAGLTRKW